MAATCTFDGCYRPVRSKGLCGAHYQQHQKGKELRPLVDAAPPRKVEAPDWTPPRDLSPAWKAAATPPVRRSAYLPRTCALSACPSPAMQGSDLCRPHDHWRAAQQRLKAQGLA